MDVLYIRVEPLRKALGILKKSAIYTLTENDEKVCIIFYESRKQEGKKCNV